MVDKSLIAKAQQVAEDFNRTYGGRFLAVTEATKRITAADIRELATGRLRGTYRTREIHEQLRDDMPTHSELVALGKLLGQMGVQRSKSGPFTLWHLDKAFTPDPH